MSKENRNVQGSEDARRGSVPVTDRQVKKAVEDAVTAIQHPKRHLSFFERQIAHALGKSIDAHGNIDLNEAANSATQGSGSRRLNPNVRESQTDAFALGAIPESATKAQRIENKAKCHQHCQKRYGRADCKHCQGLGWEHIEVQGGNSPRHLQAGEE